MTKYCVLIQVHGRDEEYVTKCFDSMTLRALFIISMASAAHIVREWEEA